MISSQGVAPSVQNSCYGEVARASESQTIKRFSGLTGYYGKFIRFYASIAHPLTKSCFLWTEDSQASFEKLKLAMT